MGEFARLAVITTLAPSAARSFAAAAPTPELPPVTKEEDWNSYDVMNKKIEDYLDGRVRVG